MSFKEALKNVAKGDEDVPPIAAKGCKGKAAAPSKGKPVPPKMRGKGKPMPKGKPSLKGKGKQTPKGKPDFGQSQGFGNPFA